MNTIIDDHSYLSRLEPISMPNPFDVNFIIDEGIMEVMKLDEIPWDDYHHLSFFLPFLNKIENDFSSMFLPEIVNDPECLISILYSESENNLGNLSATMPIIISVKPGITENII